MDKKRYCNIAELLTAAAEKYEERTALIAEGGRAAHSIDRLSFRELESLSNAYAAFMADNGLQPRMTVLMMVRPGLEMTAAVFAVFKIGAVPVMIDPGMGLRKMLRCIKDIAPEAFIAVSMAHWISMLTAKNFSSVKLRFSLGAFPPWIGGLKRLDRAVTPAMIRQLPPVGFDIFQPQPDDMAAILFTTGSTGPPKGVIYTHRVYLAQVQIIAAAYGGGDQLIDMSAFPLFAMFAIVLGMPSVIPRMDFTRPAAVDPETIIQTIRRHRVSFSFGSPAFWRTVATYCRDNGIKLSSLQRVLMAGAPVDASLHRLVKDIISPDGETLVPYGATEALPIATFTGSEMLRETAVATAEGRGYCVGYTNPGLTIKVIRCCDEVIPHWDDKLVVKDGEIGEIVIKGAVVTPGYYRLPQASAMAKIVDSDGQLWHRMGDVGYFDEHGRLFFCGRKNHRVITASRIYYPVCSEAVFNRHEAVFRTALVGRQCGNDIEPVLCVEPRSGYYPTSVAAKERFIAELRQIGSEYDFTADIKDFRFMKSFPVDIRHNAKIFREQLAAQVAD